MDNQSDVCHSVRHINPKESPLISSVMFAAGVFGNLAALVLLEIRRRREGGGGGGGARRRSLFNVLVTSLVVTDLTGTCLVSPVVLVSYSLNTTLVGMTAPAAGEAAAAAAAGGPRAACEYFGFTMTFFSLATMSILFAMALERCLAIGYPYVYGRRVTKKCAYVTIPFLLALCALFCCLPFAGFGDYVQYCPGTWCFIDMNPVEPRHRAYANLYASVMLALVLAIVTCNGSVVYHLVGMYRRRRRNGGSVTARFKRERGGLSLAEEVEHLILLVFMTAIFIVCTMPLVVRVYMNSISEGESHQRDLSGLRFISINSIIDPWVFIFLSPSMLHCCWASVCRRPLVSPVSRRRPPGHVQLEISPPPSTANGGGGGLSLAPEPSRSLMDLQPLTPDPPKGWLKTMNP